MSKELSSISAGRKFSIGLCYLAACAVMFFGLDLIHGYLNKAVIHEGRATLGVIIPNLSYGFLVCAGSIIAAGVFFYIADKIKGD